MDIDNSVKTFNNLVDAVKYSIVNPGQIVFCNPEDDHVTTLYSIKMHYKTESYQLYLKNYFYPNASVSDYIEYNFEPAGVYVSALNAIISPCFLFSWKNKEDFEKEFCLVPSFSNLVFDVKDKVKSKLIELFIGNENGTQALEKIAGKTTIINAQKNLPKTLRIFFKKYQKLVHPNIALSEIKNDLQFALERTEFSFDELIDIAKCEDESKIVEKCKKLLTHKDSQDSIVRSILLEEKLLAYVSEIQNNPSHKYNEYLKLYNAIEGKKSVVVSVQAKTGEMIDFTFPVEAFYFDSDYLETFCLTEKERKRFKEYASNKYLLTQPLIVKYRGKVIYTNVK